MRGGGVSGVQNEEDVLAMHSISGQEETAVRTSSGTSHYGPRGGYCGRKGAGGVKTTCDWEGETQQWGSITSAGNKQQEEPVGSERLGTTTKTAQTASRLPVPLSHPHPPSLPSSTLLVEVPLPLPATYPSPLVLSPFLWSVLAILVFSSIMDDLEISASCSGSGGPGANEAVLIPAPEE